MCLANVFPHSIGHLFLSLYVSFVMQKLFSLMQSHLSILAFVTYALGVISKKITAKTNVPMFCFRNFIVSGLTLKSLIHFEFIFVYGVSKYSSFIRLHVPVQFSQQYLLMRFFFFHYIFLPPLS